jgi:hypothetical protein
MQTSWVKESTGEISYLLLIYKSVRVHYQKLITFILFYNADKRNSLYNTEEQKITSYKFTKLSYELWGSHGDGVDIAVSGRKAVWTCH